MTTDNLLHPRIADGTFTDKPQSAPEAELTAASAEDVFVARKGYKNGHHNIHSEQTYPSIVPGERMIIHVGGAPHVNTRIGAAIRLYTEDEKDDARRVLDTIASENGKVTVLVDRINQVEAIEGTASVVGGKTVLFLKGSKTRYYPTEKLKLLGAVSGYGKQDQLAADFQSKAAVVPVTVPATFDGIPEYDDEAGPVDTIAAAYLIDGPDFGNGREPGCMFFATDVQSDSDIVNGYFWAPDDAGLLTSETGSFYMKELERKSGRLRDFAPNSLTFNQSWHLPSDRAAGYRQALGK
ncbi:hypothetical protein F1C58_16650 (plasmid) [Glaciihabitans sp. INWT7]|uniref:hypothetical protein n=1 Tax=Glaciihabitans sp. INWT7 TaxID=2596912 RepID=UPI00162AAFEE|nr:hypothetical protein [Glaciihabitans sp. INWT7]QNE48687.1 hypothetical protein F1C58_16650 [Glaciihabitans sp. INWT7]